MPLTGDDLGDAIAASLDEYQSGLEGPLTADNYAARRTGTMRALGAGVVDYVTSEDAAPTIDTPGLVPAIGSAPAGSVLKLTGWGGISVGDVTGLGTAATASADSFAAAGHDHTATYQPLAADLTAVAALSSTGLVERTGSGTAAIRAIGAGAGSSIPDRDAADARYAPLGATASSRVLGRKTSGAGSFEEVTASEVLDFLGSTRGSVLYRGASGWAALTPGTAGDVLMSSGAGEDPSWQTPASGDPWTYVVLASDFTTSSDTTQNVTGLAFTPAASTRYIIEASFLLRADSFAAPQPGATWPTGYSDGAGRIESATGTNSQAASNQPAGTALLSNAFGWPGADSWPGSLSAMLFMGASPSGNFQMTLQSSSSGTSVTMRAGSWLRYRTVP
jgi:hypothetical protein